MDIGSDPAVALIDAVGDEMGAGRVGADAVAVEELRSSACQDGEIRASVRKSRRTARKIA